MSEKLETLLKVKTEIEAPHGLEERILRRIHNEKAIPKGFGSIFFGRYAYGFASLAVVLIAASVMWQQHNVKIAKEEKELTKIEEEIKLYEAANSILKQVESEEKIQKEIENIEELDEYIQLLSS